MLRLLSIGFTSCSVKPILPDIRTAFNTCSADAYQATTHRLPVGGEALPDIGVVTSIGVRVPDICWQPRPTDDDPAQPAPDICVEARSPDNVRGELDAKIAAYLKTDCHKAILVELTGRTRYFRPEGERVQSAYGLRLRVPAGTYPR